MREKREKGERERREKREEREEKEERREKREVREKKANHIGPLPVLTPSIRWTAWSSTLQPMFHRR